MKELPLERTIPPKERGERGKGFALAAESLDEHTFDAGRAPSRPKNCGVSLKQLPGALALGLVAALAGHAALFHGDHAIGGAYHLLLLQGAAVAGFSFAGALGALLWSGARFAADGSVLASRIAARLPGLAMTVLSSALWFSLGEQIEPHHAATPLGLTIIALVCAAALVVGVARAAVRWIAHVAFSIARASGRPELAEGRLRLRPTPRFTQNDGTGRRFARPPPIVANARA
jgi:uncharacterized membrane-anchored protein